MKNIDDLQHGGVITDPVWLHTVRDMVSQRDAIIADLCGDKTIISGVVEDNNNNVSDGVVVYNGKVFSFIGGVKEPKVTIKKVQQFRPNATQQQAPFTYDNIMAFGTDGTETFDFEDLKRIEDLKAITVKLELATEPEMLNDNLEKLFTLKSLISRTVTTSRRALVRGATTTEVKTGTKTDCFVSPKTFQENSPVLLTGAISENGSRLSYWKKSFTCSRVSFGNYRINHNLGTTNYGLVGSGLEAGTLKVGIHERYSNYCIVQVSDDSSVNDGDFTFQVYKTA